jgi:elongation factor P hydroxylase
MKYTLKESKSYCAGELISVFNSLFQLTHQTVLVGGALEPEYIPSLDTCNFHQIHFVGDSFASALHEVSHWLIAGVERRKIRDYGYWYEPDGRDEQTQLKFETVEAYNQSFEWILASACRMKFYVSLDNLKGSTANVREFRKKVRLGALSRLKSPFHPRAKLLVDTLIYRYGSPEEFRNYWSDVELENILPEF